MSEKSTFIVRLMRWGDSSSSGRTVTLKLPDDTEDHPFKGLSVGARNGQLMEMEITLIEGDAKLETLSSKHPKKGVPKTQLPRKELSGSASSGNQSPTGNRMPGSGSDAPNPSAGGAPTTSPADGGEGMLSDGNGQSNTEATGSAHSDVNPGEIDAYANQMSNAAESLAAVAEEMSKAVDDEDGNGDGEDNGPPPLTPGEQAVVRAVDLCKSIDQQRAGFFYFMMSRYPAVPNLEAEPGNWSRDAKVTRDRVCHHCETNALDGLADDKTARQKFEALENEFERHERLR